MTLKKNNKNNKKTLLHRSFKFGTDSTVLFLGKRQGIRFLLDALVYHTILQLGTRFLPPSKTTKGFKDMILTVIYK